MARVWHRSSYSSDKYFCVEVARDPGTTAIRDSKDPNGPILTFSAATFSRFLRGLDAKRGATPC